MSKMIHSPIDVDMSSRERVISEFDQAIKPGCSLVIAPAGSGKTLAVAEWIRCRQIQTAWLTLGSADNEPLRFRTYLLASLDRIVPGIEKRMSLLLNAGPDQQSESFGMSLINELIKDHSPFTLVLDNIHMLSNEKLIKELADMIKYIQDPIHLILLGRYVPDKLMKLLDETLLHQVGAETLRFSRMEIDTFMKRNNIHLTNRQLYIIELRTEGWAMGLVLALWSIREKRNSDNSIDFPERKHAPLNVYLSEEVFSACSPEVQEFLLKTSILNRMTPDLCNAVTGRKDSHMMLKQLSKDQGFVICLNLRNDLYRYHNLLIKFLRQRLYRDYKKETHILHMKAAAYLEGNGQTREAIDFYLKARHYLGVAVLLEKIAPGMLQKQQEFFVLRRWLNALPENVLFGNGILTVSNGWTKLLEEKLRETEEIIRKAKTNSLLATKNEEQLVRQPDCLIELTLLEANLYLMEKKFEEAISNLWMVFEGKQFRTAFPDLWRTVLCRGTTNSLLAGPYGCCGRLSLLQSGRQWLYAIMAEKLNDSSGALKILQAEVHYLRNELDQAIPLLMDGLNDAQNIQAWEIYVPAVILLVKIMTVQGSYAEAYQTMTQAKEKIEKINPQATNSLLTLEANLHLLSGSIDQAALWLGNFHDSFCDHPGHCSAFDQMTRVRILISQKDYALAFLILSRMEAYFDSEKNRLYSVEISILQSVCSYHIGYQQLAMERLHAALIIGQQEGYWRMFMDEGPILLPVLTNYLRWCRRNLLDYTVDTYFIKEILKGIHQFTKKLPPGKACYQITQNNLPVEMLTAKESQVLECLEREMRNQQIAEKLGIKLTTVKSHTRSIYSKMTVTNRTQAVAFARQHNML